MMAMVVITMIIFNPFWQFDSIRMDCDVLHRENETIRKDALAIVDLFERHQTIDNRIDGMIISQRIPSSKFYWTCFINL